MNDKNKDPLAVVRAEIDAIDDQLIDLISRRAQQVLQAAAIKRRAGPDVHFYRPEREAWQLRRIMARNPGPVDNRGLARVFRELISASLALETKLDIAYLGPAGTFTEAAVGKHFGGSATPRAFASIEQVFREVAADRCGYGVVPIENSIEGVVSHTLDMFIHSELIICGEAHLRIHQNLLAAPAVAKEGLARVAKVYSHALSFAQCRQWLAANLPRAECVEVSSTAEAARLAAAESGAAAIAGKPAAAAYGLEIAARDIEDNPDNTTRFLVIGKQQAPPSGVDKTSVLFATPSKPGSLVRLLRCFADNEVNMIRIESRPSRQAMWEYVFFVDVEGHSQDAAVAAALEELRRRSSMVKTLGSYPAAAL